MSAPRRVPGVSRDPNGRTWGYVFTSVHPLRTGGRRQIRRRGFASQAAATTALRKAQEEDRILLDASDLTIGVLIEQLIRRKTLANRAPGTLQQYRWASERVLERFGDLPAVRLTSDHLDELYLELLGQGRRQYSSKRGVQTTDRPLSPRSVLIIHKTIGAALQLAVDKGQLVRNVARLATPPSTADLEPRPHYSPEQVGQLLEHLADRRDGPPRSARDWIPIGLIELLLDSGARRGEVLGLAWNDIDLDARTATIRRGLVADSRTKELSMRPTKQPRSKSTISLHPLTVELLRRRRAEQNAHRLRSGASWPSSGLAVGLVFTWGDGSPIHPDVLTRTVARITKDAGLPHLTTHGLRHSFATAALAARVPVEVVAARLGNTPRVVQEVYAHVIPADDAAAAQLVGDLYRMPRKGS